MWSRGSTMWGAFNDARKIQTMKTFALLFLVCFSESSSLGPAATSQSTEKESSWPKKPIHSNLMIENPNLFSPRMDYDEWTPLGRGDPLKNDPTYDYVPPVLERVHYWMDPSKRTPDPPLPNSGVLVLGSRTESTFTTRPTTPRYQTFQSKESQADSRIDTSSLLDPFFKLMDVSQFNLNFNSNANYKPVLNRIQRPHYQANKQRTQPPQALQRPPYTMLMPPPPPPPPVPQSTNYITTVSDKTQTTVPIPPTSNPPPTAKNATTINPTVLANTENVFKPVAISMPEHVEPFENETHNEITVKPLKKETIEPTTYINEQTHTKPFKNTEKHGQQATTTPYVKLSHKEHIKIQPRPHDSEGSNHVKKPTKMPPWYRETENRATITPPVTTTKINTLTTDPMFKHYKQPSEPIKGPFYLIIQGHSKVKTYGASKNPVNKLLTSNEIKYDDEEMKKNKFERKTRRLRYDLTDEEDDNKLEESHGEMRSFKLSEVDHLENLEETFGKSNGGSSKKRYLGSNHRRKRFVYDSINNTNRRLLSETTDADCEAEGRNATLSSDNLNLESLIAISDDYDPEDVASILLKEEGSQGSGFGGLALSIVSRSEPAGEEM